MNRSEIRAPTPSLIAAARWCVDNLHANRLDFGPSFQFYLGDFTGDAVAGRLSSAGRWVHLTACIEAQKQGAPPGAIPAGVFKVLSSDCGKADRRILKILWLRDGGERWNRGALKTALAAVHTKLSRGKKSHGAGGDADARAAALSLVTDLSQVEPPNRSKPSEPCDSTCRTPCDRPEEACDRPPLLSSSSSSSPSSDSDPEGQQPLLRGRPEGVDRTAEPDSALWGGDERPGSTYVAECWEAHVRSQAGQRGVRLGANERDKAWPAKWEAAGLPIEVALGVIRDRGAAWAREHPVVLVPDGKGAERTSGGEPIGTLKYYDGAMQQRIDFRDLNDAIRGGPELAHQEDPGDIEAPFVVTRADVEEAQRLWDVDTVARGVPEMDDEERKTWFGDHIEPFRFGGELYLAVPNGDFAHVLAQSYADKVDGWRLTNRGYDVKGATA